MRILALDQSTHITGYAIFDDEKLIQYGKFDVDGEIGYRLQTIRNKVASLIQEYEIEQLIFEDIQMQNNVVNNVQTFKLLAMVLGILIDQATASKLPYELVLASSWKSSLGVKGPNRPAQKRAAQAWVIDTYAIKPTQDECDAICIGAAYIKNNKSAF